MIYIYKFVFFLSFFLYFFFSSSICYHLLVLSTNAFSHLQGIGS